MTSKLTLTVEQSIIEKAKIYAKTTNRSLSKLIENYLENLTQENFDEQTISSKLQNIVGAVKLPIDFDEDQELRKSLEEKQL